MRRFFSSKHPAVVGTPLVMASAEVSAPVFRRAVDGELEGLEALYRAYEQPVYTLARRLCRSEADADDVLQETFLEVSKSLGRYRGEGPLLGWIKRIAASKALMRLRAQGRLESDDGTEAPLRLVHPGGDSRIDLGAALARLGDVSRAVVWLHDVEGYTHDEIAALMGRTESFSKSQLSRAHQRLRELLDEVNR